MLLRALAALATIILLAAPAPAADQLQRDGKDSVALIATASANPAPTATPTTASSALALHQPSGFATWPVITGTWGGTRPRLEAAGFTLSAMYRTDQLSDLHGGVESHGGSINQFDLQLAIDADAAFGLHGFSFFAHAIANNGGSVSRYVGDAQIVSNIESTRLTKLYQFWVRQSFLDDQVSVLVGLYDLNAEFYVTDAAVVFLNSSFGVGKELAQTGPNGPGIFPNPALTVRLRGEFGSVYAQTAVIDGHPGSKDDPYTPSFSWSRDQGVLVVAEGGVVSDGEDGGSRSKYAVGAWWYPPSVDSPLPNGGAYVLAEQQVLREDGGEEGLSLFTRVGFAELRLNRYRANFSGGGVYTGLIPGRDSDRLGLGVTFAQRNTLLDPADMEELPDRGGEVSIELAYRIQLLPSIAVQPDFQYVIAPCCSRLVGNASVFGVRFEGRF